jgi:hypothetical protein
MKKHITLTKETIETLKTLYNQIDEEMNKPCIECNIDIVTENQYKILDTIKELIFQ